MCVHCIASHLAFNNNFAYHILCLICGYCFGGELGGNLLINCQISYYFSKTNCSGLKSTWGWDMSSWGGDIPWYFLELETRLLTKRVVALEEWLLLEG